MNFHQTSTPDTASARLGNIDWADTGRRLLNLEGPICDVTNLSYLLSGMIEGLEVTKRADGSEVVHYPQGELSALFFGIYEIDRRLRSLRGQFYGEDGSAS